MKSLFKSFLIALVGVFGTATSSEALPAGVPSQICSNISRPSPGILCYYVHTNLGGKANAGGGPEGGSFTIQPQTGNYVVDTTVIEVTSQAGNGTHSKHILATGASVNSVQGYRSNLEELDRLTSEFQGKIAAMAGPAAVEATNKVNYLRERRAQYAQYYQSAVSASRNAPTTQYTWSASSRSCGFGGFDECGSWFNFNVYEVRRYLGDPIAEYNNLIVPAINQARSAVQNQPASCSRSYDPRAFRRGTSGWTGRVGEIAFVNNTAGRPVNVTLYHPDAPERAFGTWTVQPDQNIFLSKNSRNIIVAMDWGIQVDNSAICIVGRVTDWNQFNGKFIFQGSTIAMPN